MFSNLKGEGPHLEAEVLIITGHWPETNFGITSWINRGYNSSYSSETKNLSNLLKLGGDLPLV